MAHICLARFKRDFNSVAFEQVAGCKCVKHGDTYYRFDFSDGSVLELYWDESEKAWDHGLTWIQPWATSDIRSKRDTQT
jgi:hypothetical protein